MFSEHTVVSHINKVKNKSKEIFFKATLVLTCLTDNYNYKCTCKMLPHISQVAESKGNFKVVNVRPTLCSC